MNEAEQATHQVSVHADRVSDQKWAGPGGGGCLLLVTCSQTDRLAPSSLGVIVVLSCDKLRGFASNNHAVCIVSAPTGIQRCAMSWPNRNGLQTPATPEFGLKRNHTWLNCISFGLNMFHLA
jgi:hypothetical protein